MRHPRLVSGLALLLAGLSFVTASATAQPGGGATGIPWIDTHVHLVGGRGRLGQDYAGAAAAALAVMDQMGIRKMVLMPPPQVHGDPPPSDYDSFLAAIKPHPTRFAFLGGGGSLNPVLQEAASATTVGDSLRRRFEEKANEILREGAAGFGEMSVHHLSHMPGHPYESVPADHPLLLLLADIAARNDAVIDVHFDVVAEEMKSPEWLASSPNPPVLRANLAPFERLLEHNQNARIVWAHAGSDILGHWTVALSRRLLGKHPNLYMSLRLTPGRAPQNHPLTPFRAIKPEWLSLLRDFPDRFVIGGDQFILSPAIRGWGPGTAFAQMSPIVRERTRALLDALPPDLARKIGYENAVRLYKLKD